MHLEIDCIHINEVVNLVKQNGNNVLEVSEGWSKVKKVIHMQKKLETNVKLAIQHQQPLLRYWKVERTQHNPSEEGFTCDQCKIGITFPN